MKAIQNCGERSGHPRRVGLQALAWEALGRLQYCISFPVLNASKDMCQTVLLWNSLTLKQWSLGNRCHYELSNGII
ncbi:hypothetical protein H671_6g15294 [Cricetulus griseus]|nr:hypothetical protein H671_6g15294 [Cricetulus griseus]